MQPAAAYRALLDHHRETSALAQALDLLHWDQETMMPPKAAPARAEQCAALERVVHERRTAPVLAEWLAILEAAPLPDAVGSANAASDIRHARRALDRATKIPVDLAAALAKETALAQGVWAQARQDRRFAAFAPALRSVLALKRDEAACLGHAILYDGLLDSFEPEARSAELEGLFGRLRPVLRELLQRVQAARLTAPEWTGPFARAAQLELGRQVAVALGYDFDAGRLDVSAHPFSIGQGRDVRITTRVDEHDPMDCLFSTLHETGHALYEQGIADAILGTPSGEAASMGVHESQSRLWENQVGRSRAFCEWIWPRARATLGTLGPTTPEALWRAVNHIAPSFIRTESDEVTYNLHVMLRFDLERALLSGDLDVGDLPAAWNERMTQDLGITPPHDGVGVLQDVHWGAGLWGYFPTYTLGNVYSAALWEAMGAQVDRDGALARGEYSVLLAWLRDNVHVKGRLRDARTLLAEACRGPVDEAPLVRSLTAKVAALTA